MGELKTLNMGVSMPAGSGTSWIERIVEEAIRIKKVIICIRGEGTKQQLMKAILAKHKVDLTATVENGRIADIAYIDNVYGFTTSGAGLAGACLVVDFGADWIEVQEDGILYLGCYVSTGAAQAQVWIFYEER